MHTFVHRIRQRTYVVQDIIRFQQTRESMMCLAVGNNCYLLHKKPNRQRQPDLGVHAIFSQQPSTEILQPSFLSNPLLQNPRPFFPLEASPSNRPGTTVMASPHHRS